MKDFEIVDPVFKTFVMHHAPLEKLAGGFRWTEGPVWFGDGGYLLFSDIPNNRIMRWSERDGLGVFREPSNYSNGHTRDRQGRLVSCEHGARRVTRTEYDGTITVLADGFDGKRFNSPNDVVVKSDDSVWFTDPHYGIATDYEGFRSEQELPCQVYRLDPASGELTVVASDFDCPNGLCFSPDERKLYIADTGRFHDLERTRHMRVFDVGDDGRSLTGGEVFYVVDVGASDGFRADEDGNIWTSAGDGVHCINPQGELLGKILVPEIVSNVTFGGPRKSRLFICGTTSLYTVFVTKRGVQWP
ncbi:MAG: SMP-30/gluconolactonase/LRE family protein [Geminicoccaceae bacterium]